MKIAAQLDASPKVINNWRQAFRMHSVQIPAAGAVLAAIAPSFAYAIGAIALRDVVSMRVVCYVFAAIFITNIIARLITQPKLKDNS